MRFRFRDEDGKDRERGYCRRTPGHLHDIECKQEANKPTINESHSWGYGSRCDLLTYPKNEIPFVIPSKNWMSEFGMNKGTHDLSKVVHEVGRGVCSGVFLL